MIGGVRARAILDEYAVTVVVAALALAVAGGVVTYDAHATPNERQVDRTVEDYRVDGTFAHRSTVREGANTTTFEPGATVRNRSVYFSRVMPGLDGRLSLRYANAASPATVRVDSRLVVESVAGERGTEEWTVYWRDVRPLGSNATTLAPGDRTTVPFSLNVSRTIADARNESARLGAPGVVRTRVVFDVTVEREGASDADTFSFVLPITTDGTVYRVEDAPRSMPFNHTTTTTVADPPGATRAAGGPFALAVGLLGATVVLALRATGRLDVDDDELAQLAYREDRTDYADWITDGRLPSAARDRPRVAVDSLAGLADVAIDAGERVVHDRERGEYAVVHGDLLYVFEPPTDPGGDARGETDDALTRTDASAAPDLLDDPATFDDPGDDAGAPETVDVPVGENAETAETGDVRVSDDARAAGATDARVGDERTPDADAQD